MMPELTTPRWLRELGVLSLFVSEGTHGPGICYESREIEISRQLTPLSRYEVFLHELIHVLHPEWSEAGVEKEMVQTLIALEMPLALDEAGHIIVECED